MADTVQFEDNFLPYAGVGVTIPSRNMGYTLQFGVPVVFQSGIDGLVPATTLTSSLGSPTDYWLNVYSRRYYLNSTAYIDGTTAGTIDASNSTIIRVSQLASGASGKAVLTPNGNTGGWLLATNAAANRGLVLQGSSAQSANLFTCVDNNAAVLSYFDSGGNLGFSDAKNIILGTTTGTKIGTATTQKLAFYNSAPVVQPATTGTTTGFTAGTGTTVVSGSTFTGNTGSTAYTIGDIVNALKNLGLMAA